MGSGAPQEHDKEERKETGEADRDETIRKKAMKSLVDSMHSMDAILPSLSVEILSSSAGTEPQEAIEPPHSLPTVDEHDRQKCIKLLIDEILGRKGGADYLYKMITAAPAFSAVKKRSEMDDWKRIDDIFYGLIRRANWSFLVNAYINIVLVAIGVVLIVYAMATAWTRGNDIAAGLTGIGGIVAVVSTFFVGPQERIPKHMGDLCQIQMLYRTYTLQADTFNDWVFYNEIERKLTAIDLSKAYGPLEHATRELSDLVEKLVGPEEKTAVEVLKRRLARGEITTQQYDEMKKMLQEK